MRHTQANLQIITLGALWLQNARYGPAEAPMTIMHIAIPDDLKEAFEKKFPGETIEQAVQRLLRKEVADQSTSTSNRSLVDMARSIRDQSPPTSDEEIWAIRQELRT
jgi:hypothetical protein